MYGGSGWKIETIEKPQNIEKYVKNMLFYTQNAGKLWLEKSLSLLLKENRNGNN